MSTTEREVTRREQMNDEPRIVHWYPRDAHFRKSGMSPPQVGDIARCGWVKRIPHHPSHTTGPECVVCEDLRRQARR